jgi:hypothetical protein
MATFRLLDAAGDYLVDADGNYLVWQLGGTEAATARMSLTVAAPTITLTLSEDD